MFENLSDRLQGIAHKIKGYGKITEDNISDMMSFKNEKDRQEFIKLIAE